MDKPLLCISWLNGQFKAVAMNRGVAKATWERPGLVADFADFPAVLAEAVANTRPESKQVAMVLAHPRLGQQVIEVPLAKGRTLERILERHARSIKTFSGEPAWSSQPAIPTKNSNAMLMQIFPQTVVDQLAGACKQNGLELIRLLSTTAVLGSQLRKLPLEKDELGLLAAETGTTTTVVIGRTDGRVCLSRVLLSRWNQQIDPLTVELTRTIGFAEQQSGLVVGSVWLFGTGGTAQAPALESQLQLPVKVSPVECSPFYWAEQAAKLPEKDDGNLISLEARQAPQRRRLLTATTLLLLILLLASLATAGFIEMLRGGWLAAIRKQDVELARLEKQRETWRERNGELAGKVELVRAVLDDKPPPLPSWFLGYLSEAVPDELLVTELRVVRTNAAWLVQMAGLAQPTRNPSHAAQFRAAAVSMTNNLASGPFRMKIRHNVLREAAGGTAQAGGAGHTFLIEGVIE